MTIHWWTTAWEIGADVDKPDIHAGFKTYVPAVLTVAELRALTADGLRCAIVSGQVYLYDPTDTTTLDDGDLVIVSADGKRFERTSGMGGGIAILGVLEDEGDLPGSGDAGDAYIIDGELWVYDGADWANAGTFAGPAGAGFVWQGAWVTATAYNIADGVSRNGSGYTCIVSHTSGASTEPGVGVSWATYWSLFASKGDTGDPGVDGDDGAPGTDGTDPGVRWLFDDGTGMSAPGSGNLRLNHASFASVTAAAVSDLCGETGGPDVSAWVLEWDDSTNTIRGTLIVKAAAAPENFAIYNITGASTDNSGWTQLALTHVASAGAFIDTEILAVQFVRAGNKGADGAGAGDVVGPATSTDGHFAQFDGTTGELLKGGLALSTDGTLAGNSDTLVPSQKAVKTYADQLIAASDAMVFCGTIDASANPNYPAANRGNTYRISVAGKIGGGSGLNVEVGDLIICLTDSTAGGNHATVGASWSIAQTNLDGAVIGPASAIDNAVAVYDGTSGKLIKGGGYTISDILVAAAAAVPANVPAASLTVAGKVEMATAVETTTGTDTARAVSPGGLAASDFGKTVVGILVFTDAQDVVTGDGAGDVFWRVPSVLNGYNLVSCAAHVQTAGTTGTTDIQIARTRSGSTVDMLSTKLTIDSTEIDTASAAAAAVINASNDDVATADRIRIDVDATSTTKAKGLYVELTFQLP